MSPFCFFEIKIKNCHMFFIITFKIKKFIMTTTMKCLSIKRKVWLYLKRCYRKNIFLCNILLVIWILLILKCITINYKHSLINQYIVEMNRSIPIKNIDKTLKNSIEQDKGTGCEMPDLDPYSKEMLAFDKDMPKIVCKGTDWVECDNECYVIDAILIKRNKNILCEYRDIIYKNDQEYSIGGPVVRKGNERYFLVASDHVKVSCRDVGIDGQGRSWSGNKAGFRLLPPKYENSTHQRPTSMALNFMIIGFDSASKNGFIRKMPKSYKFLTENLETVILKSYNILGDGTPWALFPMLTGKSELELPERRKSFLKDEKFIDDSVFLFSILRKYGYKTAYFEDSPLYGTFQYRFFGFENMPADHYLRPFFMEEAKTPSTEKEKYCVGGIPQYALMLNLTKKFMSSRGKKFGFTFISDISHDDFNMISTADEDFVSFLENYKKRHISNTMLMVMGDHGPRYRSGRETYQGLLEERLPLMAIVPPLQMRRNREFMMKNLKYNSDVLCTPFDIHCTLLHALWLPSYVNKYVVPGAQISRGISLFSPIPKSRSCSEAGILPHWCTCIKWSNVSSSYPEYELAANALVAYINSLTSFLRSRCMERRLESIEWVRRQAANDMVLRYKGSVDADGYIARFDQKSEVKASNQYYQVKVSLSPGDAIFEGTLNYIQSENRFLITEADISRINVYGDEPDCISETHPHLDKFCYCMKNANGKV